jgi:hypothetical protein
MIDDANAVATIGEGQFKRQSNTMHDAPNARARANAAPIPVIPQDSQAARRLYRQGAVTTPRDPFPVLKYTVLGAL